MMGLTGLRYFLVVAWEQLHASGKVLSNKEKGRSAEKVSLSRQSGTRLMAYQPEQC